MGTHGPGALCAYDRYSTGPEHECQNILILGQLISWRISASSEVSISTHSLAETYPGFINSSDETHESLGRENRNQLLEKQY